MAVAFRSLGTFAAPATGAVTPGMPGSLVTNDILICGVRTQNAQAATIANQAGGTWTEFPTVSPLDQTSSGLRGTLFWSRYNGTQTAPTTNDSGVVNCALIVAYSGCVITGDPYDVTNSNAQDETTTAASVTGAVSTVDAVMAVAISVCRRDANSTTNATAWANGSLASITERFDQISATGAGGGFAIADGIKTSAGTISATTWTQAAAGGLVHFLVTLKPEPVTVLPPRPTVSNFAVVRSSNY